MRVEMDAVSVHFGAATVLDEVTAAFEAGQRTGLIGPNGSGKSTLLRCLYRALQPSRGSIRLDGQELGALSRRETARRIGAVVQHGGGHLGYTVAESVMLGRFPHGDLGSAAAHRICAEAMAETGIRHLGERNVLELSGGERQRVCIARALAQQTPILLLDEPLNHLDIRHQLELLRYLRGSERTTVMAIHDIHLAAQSCDRLILLDAGRLIAAGTPDQVLLPELIERVYGVRPTVTQTAAGPPDICFRL